jgi:choline dehydrogenase-like flavoprotein
MSRFDYIVIGAVSAECAVAERLPPDPSRFVLVMKAGGLDRRLARAGTACVQLADGSATDWGCTTEPEPGCADRQLLSPRGKVMERPRS